MAYRRSMWPSPRFVTELPSPWRARLVVGLVARYEECDLAKLHYAELDRLSRRLDRLIGDEAEPFEPEEFAGLPLQSTARVECLRDRVSHEMCLRGRHVRDDRRPELHSRMVATTGGRPAPSA
jgi:hypothetical protein